MTFRLMWKLAMRNFVSLRRIIFPFVISMAMMFAMQYILFSLFNNEFLEKRSDTTKLISVAGDFFVSLLLIIFILYANRFVMKQRKKEFALNIILGMEKKHLRLILLIESIVEYIVTAVLSIIGGYLFGLLLFVLLNKLTENKHFTPMDYPFDVRAMLITIIALAVVMLVLFIINNVQISLQSPLGLLQSGKKVEKQRSKWFLSIIGFVGVTLVIIAYSCALMINPFLNEYHLLGFLCALASVILGTYLLFMSCSVLVLRALKSIPSIYYQKVNFFSISGLLSRMKVNAVSLASITLLCTFLVVTLSLSLTTYRGIQKTIVSLPSEDYTITQLDDSSYDKQVKSNEKIIQELRQYTKIKDIKNVKETTMMANEHKGEIREKGPGSGIMLNLKTEKDFNRENHERLHLKKDEIGIGSNLEEIEKSKHLKLLGHTFRTRHLNEDHIDGAGALSYAYIVVKDQDVFNKVTQHVTDDNSLTTNAEARFNVNNSEAIEPHKEDLEDKYKVQIESKKERSSIMIDMFGGFVFLGTIVSITLLIGIFLMMYYKQVSEGFEDHRNYQIMKKVGLDKSLIKRIIRKQIIWIFALPMGVTIVHSLVASKMAYRLLGSLMKINYQDYLVSNLIILVLVTLIYGFIYLITSSTYYNTIYHGRKDN
ncbi:ABC transporter permease [Staphylococcus pettenkoferi]|uniref:ABC transporter permease n=2 Tax=Staphylococcus pettenkoferi TaxID=170573 RepID=A0A2N6QDR6_9STAP|nr:FtsX-like permease family protein [Staphylococcus pettenkoferi]MBX8994210.1 FtsX-like permease family protein [Staphylococcus pettenkoferi]MCI2792008.1 FtsX-like permease family protein [Staphylococcus pettenkoferi]MCY1567495.1 FtsX-like permease family protein [Staphylococcus pettenkoferi]MCY1588793.1 FtsX-like permease family protein [Staphylococcus pettenkoferi]MCY1604877.1 FtsX-like permease family protein [Staphylococcus pettenkoferi]